MNTEETFLHLQLLGLLPGGDLALQLLPLLLLGQLLLLVLGLHLLDLDGVGLPPPHVEFVITHAESEDPLVDAETRCEEHEVWSLLVNGLGIDREISRARDEK